MLPSIRQAINEAWSVEAYQAYKRELYARFNYDIEFRIAESPIFIPAELKNKLVQAGEDIIQTIKRPDFKEITKGAIPTGLAVPDEDAHTTFLALDFAVCKDEAGEYEPQLIELQGFPSLYCFQEVISQVAPKYFQVPEGYRYLFGDLTSETYIALLRKAILGGHDPKHVILLEIEPEAQKTKVDFYATKEYIGIQYVCMTEVEKEGDKLYYYLNGERTQIKRIYNRVIFDDLARRTDLTFKFDITEPCDVEWAGHPNWFFRISKYLLPFLESPFVPKTYFLSDLKEIPKDLENYVLKPLYSFAGKGVVFDVKPEDIATVEQSDQFVLMRKVQYADAIASPTGPVKVEIRLLYIWPQDEPHPTLGTTLIRMSKGKMMGVAFNKEHDWVGGSVAFLAPW